MQITLCKAKPPLPSFIGSANSDTAILFIHGFFSSRFTWGKFANHLKTHWREDDSFNLQYDQYYGEQGILLKIPLLGCLVRVKKVFSAPGISDLSLHLRTVIEQQCEAYENIIIIAHSMGGLVARKYIVDRLKSKKDVGKIKGLITYATPHHGSQLANYYNNIMSITIAAAGVLQFRQSEQIFDLNEQSGFITNLNADWSSLNVDDKIDFKRVIGYGDWVVKTSSAQYALDDNVNFLANKDHFDIIKPGTINDAAFMVTYNYLKHFRDKLEAKREFEAEAEAYEEEQTDDNG